jgi:hypothetical protein
MHKTNYNEMTWPSMIRIEARALRANVRMDDLIDSLTRSRSLNTNV